MAEPTTKRIKIWQALLIIVSIIIAAPIAMISNFYILGPLRDVLDRDSFNRLDLAMRDLNASLDHASAGQEDWKYTKECESSADHIWSVDPYLCSTHIIMNKEVHTAKAITQLHDKYYPLIQNSNIFTPKDNLAITTPDIFGIEFQVSNAMQYNMLKQDSNVSCTYNIALGQMNPTYDNNRYGKDIEKSSGLANMSIDCTKRSYRNWY